MASDIDTATPERGPRRALWSSLLSALGRLIPVFRRAPRAAANESPSLLRRRRSTGRRYSPLTRRILLLNIVPVALLALGAVYLSDYEEELIDAERVFADVRRAALELRLEALNTTLEARFALGLEDLP